MKDIVQVEKANLIRLKRCMKKAEEGKELTIGFIGGSITRGSLASSDEKTYANRVFSWWAYNFPDASFKYINAGIGGTTSHYGVARAEDDILKYNPDFVVVDFTVNDESTPFFQETFEGLIRKLLTWDSKPAVFVLCNAFYDSGINAQDYHIPVCKRYKLPYISVRDTLYRKIQEGAYSVEELSPDGLHPNDKGHRLIAEEITRVLDFIKEKGWRHKDDMNMPAPITENYYEGAVRLTNTDINPAIEGFEIDGQKKQDILDYFKKGWIGRNAGDRIYFGVKASCIAVQFRQTVNRPAARALLVLDGDSANPIILDGNFDEDWGDYLCLKPVLHHGEYGKHTLDIRILDDGLEQMTPFYLMSLVVSGCE